MKARDAEGNVLFDGKLTSKELDFVVNIGVNYLLAKGVSPWLLDKSEEGDDDSMAAPGSDSIQ